MYRWRLLCCFLSTLAVVSLSGCSASFDPLLSGSAPVGVATGTLKASVHGGRQPITGAHVYMFAADSTAYGHASDSLLLPYATGSYPSVKDSSNNYYVVTDSAGGFNLAAGQYTCTAGQLVYFYAIGGDPGSGSNPAAGLLSVLGQCGEGSTFPGVTYVTINELSTVAAAYAISGYAVDATHVAYPGTALAKIGITNAFANAGNLYNISVGGPAQATTTVGSGTVPQELMNSLANSLAGCINSTGVGSGACNLLLNNANSTGAANGTAAADTATAAINLAHHPAYQVAQILAAGPSISAPYVPSLAGTPDDLTLGITFTGGGIAHPKDIAVDGNGSVWVSSDAANKMTKLSALGVPASSTGYTVADAGFIAIDTSNQAWVTSATGNAVYALTSSGTAVSGSPFAPTFGILIGVTSMLSPEGIAFDNDGDILVASEGNSNLYKLTAAGAALAGPFNSAGTSGVFAVAVDTNNNVWTLGGTKDLCEIGGLFASQLENTTSGMSGAKMLADDANGNVWVTNYTSSTVSQYAASNANQVGSSPFTGGGLANPYGIAMDGASNAWIANEGNSSVSEFTSSGTALSPANGFTGGSQSGTLNIAVDGSGDVWVTNATANNVTELIGAAVPVITPLAAATIAKTPGTRP